MSTTRRPVAAALVSALATGGLLLTASPAAAIPFEGTPDPAGCQRLVTRAIEWPSRPSDNTRLVSHGYALFLATQAECDEPRG